jgi:hypothetical protein
MRRGRLDALLAGGADPRTRSELELRARQLVSEGERARLAGSLAAALSVARDAAGRAEPPITARVPLRSAALRACAADVEELVRRLRDPQPVAAWGVALTRRLLFDGAGPLYCGGPLPLSYTVRWARLALDPLETDEANGADVERVEQHNRVLGDHRRPGRERNRR